VAKFKFLVDESGLNDAVPCSVSEHAALRALQAGNATAEQQQLALKWIVEKAAAYYELSYRPGDERGRRETDWLEGRRFVGAQIIHELRPRAQRKEGTPAT